MSNTVDSTEIENLEPKIIWQLFAGIAAVPRPSKCEGRIRQHVREIAEQTPGLVCREDAAGNLIITVPASPGCEAAPITVLQGHLDMVGEKNNDVEHDFERHPIRLILDREPDTNEPFIHADGTTLGADNGIGVAMGLAVARSPDLKHGPLELLLTVDEEAGMTGAKQLTPETFRGRRLLNLDSEEDHALYIGCAGGCDTTVSWAFPLQTPDPDARTARVTVDGLRGGHSGCDIHENRGNANKILVRTLLAADPHRLRLARISGGSKRNAIPREARALIAATQDDIDGLIESARRVCAEAGNASAEPGLAIRVEPVADDPPVAVMTPADSQRLLTVVHALPHGVMGMNPAVPDLVQTSNNVATISDIPNREASSLVVEVGTLSRSSSTAWLDATCAQIASVGRLAGAAIQTGNSYPGWEPNFDSPVLAVCRRVYQGLFGAPPHVTAIHAGLECGIIDQRVGGMDMVSFGPRITGAHSPDERVYVNSVQKSWNYLKAVLEELSRP